MHESSSDQPTAPTGTDTSVPPVRREADSSRTDEGGLRNDRSPLLLVERIVALGRGWSRRQHELCRLLAEYDLTGEWAFSGSVVCSRWAADALEVDVGTAREWLRVGHAMRELEVVDEAFATGALSFSKVRALSRIAVDHPDRQDELVALALSCTASALPWELARWSSSEEDPIERDQRHRREMSLSVRTEPDGSAVITARLPPVDAATAMAAIDAGMHRKVGAERLTAVPPPTTQRGEHPPADAKSPRSVSDRSDGAAIPKPSLGARRAASFVGLLANNDSGTVSTEVLIHVRGDGATLSDGTPIADHLVERLAPTAFFRVLVHDAQRRPINASGRQRHPTTRQRRVVSARDDHTCTAPGCDSSQFLEIDHDPPYEETGHTVIDELRVLCSAHHRERHAPEGRG